MLSPDPMLDGCAGPAPEATRVTSDWAPRNRALDAPDPTGFSMVGIAG